jgi:alpha-tubulin suppressor-like RCC1 family protein
VLALDTKWRMTCAVRNDGTVWCFGDNQGGQLGTGDKATPVATPIQVEGLPPVVDVALQSFSSFALTAAGEVWAWGANGDGQLGNDSTTESLTPVKLGLEDIVQLVTGADHTCARNDAGVVFCWGRNGVGEVGNGTMAPVLAPLEVLTGVAQLSAGGRHNCARMLDNTVRCWGENADGQCGQLGSGNVTVPTAIAANGYTATAVAVNGLTSCALRAAGAVDCWGANRDGVLVPGAPDNVYRETPRQLVDSGVLEIYNAARRVCVRSGSGQVDCWGANPPIVPTMPPPSTFVIRETEELAGLELIAGSSYHMCVRGSDGELACSGRNSEGQLGDGTLTPRTDLMKTQMPCPAP